MYTKNTNALKEIRIEKNITISELAAKLKVTNNLIVKWESGMDYIPLKYLIALSKYWMYLLKKYYMENLENHWYLII